MRLNVCVWGGFLLWRCVQTSVNPLSRTTTTTFVKSFGDPSSHPTALHQLNSTIDDFHQFTNYFFPLDWTSPTQFREPPRQSLSNPLVINWTPIKHLHHESVCDQSQLNASMRVCVINRNWTPPWIACWPINQLINWSTSTPWLADHLINWSTSTPWLADQLINWLRLTWSTSSTSTSWINFDSLVCLLTN